MFKIAAGYLLVLGLLAGVISPVFGGTNLLKNPGFEEIAQDQTSSWAGQGHPDASVIFKTEPTGAHQGTKCFSLTNTDYNDAWLTQEVKVERNKTYLLRYWVKIDQPLDKQVGGANISIINGIYSSPEIFDTHGQWEEHEVFVRTNDISPEVLQVTLRLGGYGAANKGKAYFDDVVMEQIANPPVGVVISDLGNVDRPAGNNQVASNNEGHKESAGLTVKNKTVLYVLLGLVILGLLVYVEVKFAKKNQPTGIEETAGDEEND